MKKNPAEELDRMELVVQLLQGTGKSTLKSAARSFLVRAPEHVLAELDAMATIGKKSRNSMVVHLLMAAMDQVRDALDDKTRRELDAKISENRDRMNSDVLEREQLEA
jgi:hypothetical protein